MRRPRFKRWIRSEVLRLAGTNSFSLRKFAAKAQRERNPEFDSALLLHAHESGQYNRLMSYLYDEELMAEYRAVEQRLGGRSVERLAFRGTPMMTLPDEYRAIMSRFVDAYHAPELIAEEKRTLWESTRRAVLMSGTSPAELARELGLDPANLSAYLARADVGRFTLATARTIAEYVA